MINNATELVRRARKEIAAQARPNRFLDLLDAGVVPTERLWWLAGELYRLIGSDRRSYALLASRYPSPPAGDLFLGMANADGQALGLLMDFAAAVGMDEQALREYEPLPLAQAYPAYLAQCALSGTSSAVALAILADLDGSAGYCIRAADTLRTRYGLSEDAVGVFRFIGDVPPSLAAQAEAVITEGVADGEDPREAVRAARILHAYEAAFWDTLAEGLG